MDVDALHATERLFQRNRFAGAEAPRNDGCMLIPAQDSEPDGLYDATLDHFGLLFLWGKGLHHAVHRKFDSALFGLTLGSLSITPAPQQGFHRENRASDKAHNGQQCVLVVHDLLPNGNVLVPSSKP